MRGALLTVLSAGAFFQCLESVTLPPNPCPDLFQYLQDKNGIVYGRLTLENDYSGHYDLSVNMSYSEFLDDEEQNIKVEIDSTTDDMIAGRLLLYKIFFPTQSVIPRLARIELNKKVHCSGLAEELDSRMINKIWGSRYQNRTHEQKLQLGIITPTLQPPTETSITFPSEHWQLPAMASQTSASLTWESWQKTSTTTTTAAPLPNKRLRRELSTTLSSTLWHQTSTAPRTSTPLSSKFSTYSTKFYSLQWLGRGPTTSTPLSSEFSTYSTKFYTLQWLGRGPTTATPLSSEFSTYSTKFDTLQWLGRGPTTSTPLSSEPSTYKEYVHSSPISRPSVAATTECGLPMVNTQDLVVNEGDFVDGQFPWLVAILYREDLDYSYKCTGSLVSNRHVITAGHCVNLNLENYMLVFGKKQMQDWEIKAVQRKLEDISVHPDYKGNKGASDIAILTVKEQIQFKADIKPVCLFHGEEHVDKMDDMQGTVVGWWTDEKRGIVDAKKVDLSIVPQLECLRSYPFFLNIISFKTLCAEPKGAGPCRGDSGAGFVMQKNGRWILRGVMSTTLGDLRSCDVENYFVFVDIDKVRNWLKLVMT